MRQGVRGVLHYITIRDETDLMITRSCAPNCADLSESETDHRKGDKLPEVSENEDARAKPI